MNTIEEAVLIVLMSLVLITPSVLFTWYYFTRIRNKKPSYYGRQVHKILRRYAALHRYKVLRNASFQVNGKPASFSHLLIGPFGLLIVSTLDKRGSYFGDAKSQNWILDDTKSRTELPNPYLKNQKAIELLRVLFAKEQIYKVPVEQLIIYDSYAKKTGCFTGNDVAAIRLSKLREYLAKEKYEKDNGVDMERVAALFTQQDV